MQVRLSKGSSMKHYVEYLVLRIWMTYWLPPQTSSLIFQIWKRFLTLANYPKPTTPRALRRFLAMVNFYRRFIPHAALQQAELYDLIKNRKKTIQNHSSGKK
ncbi:hypothetical protein AVEN_241916-1 [Araneus ventricosus]|uniref:Uncharacterized protein n=1 Tax=Araneus ventricosus TaxID=182803 RepID=A0A4Y2SAG0_ARAVE|nr:hypothetical protein AVEN_133373-1 [Araneus ventricosus]GBN84833.1 hypothetical protein AVEN_241916-1 [Araneus ventricosus]